MQKLQLSHQSDLPSGQELNCTRALDAAEARPLSASRRKIERGKQLCNQTH
jgi:hypothetical protein